MTAQDPVRRAKIGFVGDKLLELAQDESAGTSSSSDSSLPRDRVDNSMISDAMPSKVSSTASGMSLIVRLRLPASFDRACFVSLDFFSSKEPLSGSSSLSSVTRKAQWKCVGTTEPVGVVGETESALSSGTSNSIFPFVAVLEVPVVGHASNTLLRFLVHASTIGKRDTGHNFAANYLDGEASSFGNGGSGSRNETPATQLSYQMTMFHPLLEFVTSSQAVLDAAASGQPLNIHPTDEHTCTILEDHPSLQRDVDMLSQKCRSNAELEIQRSGTEGGEYARPTRKYARFERDGGIE